MNDNQTEAGQNSSLTLGEVLSKPLRQVGLLDAAFLCVLAIFMMNKWIPLSVLGPILVVLVFIQSGFVLWLIARTKKELEKNESN